MPPRPVANALPLSAVASERERRASYFTPRGIKAAGTAWREVQITFSYSVCACRVQLQALRKTLRRQCVRTLVVPTVITSTCTATAATTPTPRRQPCHLSSANPATFTDRLPTVFANCYYTLPHNDVAIRVSLRLPMLYTIWYPSPTP